MRARNIKPGFFRNEELGQMDPFTRLVFIGLWCAADRDGRIEYRPLRLKADILPYDSRDINRDLTVLERSKFITLYEVDEKQYIQVNGFKEHQNPHHTEAVSKIPDISNGCIITVNSPLNTGEYPADSLIPDSLIQDSKEGDTSPQSLEDVIWKTGVKILVEAGTSEKSARTFLGKHVKLHKDRLASVITQMALHPPIEPAAYIEKALQPKKIEVVL